MKIKYSALVSDASGKLNGSVASRNKGGSYLRNKGVVTNRNTTAQIAVRNVFTALSQQWRGLSVLQRASWDNAAPNFSKNNIFGDSKSLSGFGLFKRINGNLGAVNQPYILIAPAPTAVPFFTALSVAVRNSLQSVTTTFAPAIPAGVSVIVRATPPLSAGISFVKSEFRQIAILTVTDTSPAVISAAYIAKFGNVGSIGQKVFIQLRVVNNANGLTGIDFQAFTFVIA